VGWWQREHLGVELHEVDGHAAEVDEATLKATAAVQRFIVRQRTPNRRGDKGDVAGSSVNVGCEGVRLLGEEGVSSGHRVEKLDGEGFQVDAGDELRSGYGHPAHLAAVYLESGHSLRPIRLNHHAVSRK
jgi:hypothetical protein